MIKLDSNQKRFNSLYTIIETFEIAVGTIPPYQSMRPLF